MQTYEDSVEFQGSYASNEYADGSNEARETRNTLGNSVAPEAVIARIEYITTRVLDQLNEPKEPYFGSTYIQEMLSIEGILQDEETDVVALTKKFNLMQCRSFTSVLLVLSFVHALLLSNRTTTTREVYYYFVTHFRTQRECDVAIMEAASLLRVPRVSLGLAASPKGWFCGCLRITRPETGQNCGEGSVHETVIDGSSLSSVQGLPITREWIDRSSDDHRAQAFQIVSQHAKCILVIEKEGVYNRLSEDRFFERYPCILVTGKGFPDLATRALVHSLHHELQLPVYGLCDCNPYGVGVLQTYQRGSTKMGLDGGSRYTVPIQWIGLRPSQVASMKADLPRDVYQSLTELDERRIESLCRETSPFTNVLNGYERRDELRCMAKAGYKVELEALHWLGMDFMCDWLEEILVRHENGTNNDDTDEESEEDNCWKII
uniref:DNA topoisomerase (ATP-hydrolyzing) n=1 Tax=Attheya septentrionalis TaxID=420275 RepID=A0A7S2UM25_9STRA|mmetsp:Transcript_4015/g.7193  ORF Transcript_4015/g.7193 Transcript_4015/m.7193 type:complete len:434 (+) Transcript_4015:880-2181(+)